MKKLLVSLILLGSILISSFAYAITEKEVGKYLDKDVFVMINHIIAYGFYGKIIDIVYVRGELHVILNICYNQERQLMYLLAKDIGYIRERKSYE